MFRHVGLGFRLLEFKCSFFHLLAVSCWATYLTSVFGLPYLYGNGAHNSYYPIGLLCGLDELNSYKHSKYSIHVS